MANMDCVAHLTQHPADCCVSLCRARLCTCAIASDALSCHSEVVWQEERAAKAKKSKVVGSAVPSTELTAFGDASVLSGYHLRSRSVVRCIVGRGTTN